MKERKREAICGLIIIAVGAIVEIACGGEFFLFLFGMLVKILTSAIGLIISIPLIIWVLLLI